MHRCRLNQGQEHLREKCWLLHALLRMSCCCAWWCSDMGLCYGVRTLSSSVSLVAHRCLSVVDDCRLLRFKRPALWVSGCGAGPSTWLCIRAVYSGGCTASVHCRLYSEAPSSTDINLLPRILEVRCHYHNFVRWRFRVFSLENSETSHLWLVWAR